MTQIETHPSDYLGLRNIERKISSLEEDAFSQSDVEDFLDPDVEARNYVHPEFDPDEDGLEVEEFKHLRNRIQKCINEIFISHGKDDVNSFFNSICYAVRYALTQRSSACEDSEMEEDLPCTFFEKILDIKESLILDLRLNTYKSFEMF